MDALVAAVSQLVQQSGANASVFFEAELLVPERRIRELCLENRCGKYGKHYMCPPYVGSVAEIESRLSRFRRGVLLQYSRPLDVRNDPSGLRQTKIDFHSIVLLIEESLKKNGAGEVWGMIGGSCELCLVCRATTVEPCLYPDKARTSLESMAVDVMALLDKLGLDNRFRPDRITWTGCVLF